jgi:hypothetical protein
LPKHGPYEELHHSEDLSFPWYPLLNGLFLLLTRLNTKALVSLTQLSLELHASVVNPPKIFPFVDFIIVNVFAFPSHFEWNSLALNPSLDPL